MQALGYTWPSRLNKPKKCAGCRTPYWDRKRRDEVEEAAPEPHRHGGLTPSEWEQVFIADYGADHSKWPDNIKDHPHFAENVTGHLSPQATKVVLLRALCKGNFEEACIRLGVDPDEAWDQYIMADKIEKYGPDTDRRPPSVSGSTMKPPYSG